VEAVGDAVREEAAAGGGVAGGGRLRGEELREGGGGGEAARGALDAKAARSDGGELEAAAVAHAGGEEGLLHDPLEVVVVGTHTLAKSFLPIYDVSYVVAG
jgi:hypothetical protein